MPFFLVPDASQETSPIDVDGLTAYTDRQTAHAALSTGLRVVYISVEAERDAWHMREIARFNDGTYIAVPWVDIDEHPSHYCHLAISADGMVAFTPDDEAGYLNRKTRIKAGRYLERFYAHVNLETRIKWAAECCLQPIALARTPDEIETVYRNAIGCNSCMGPNKNARFTVHPTRAYGNSDLAVAYLGPMDNATARSVVWPDQKRHTTIYGDRDRMTAALAAAGYVRGSIDGARIRAIDHRGGYLMPYIDDADCAEDLGDGWLRLGDGDIDVKTTSGVAEPAGECDNCNGHCPSDETYCQSCLDDRFDCDRCGDATFDTDYAPYCYDCDQNRTNCENCNDDTWDETFTAIGRYGYEITICEHCADNSHRFAFTCTHCDSDESEARYDIDDQRTRIKQGTAHTLCLDCVSSGVAICPDCEQTRDDVTIACPDCDPGVATAADLTAVCEAS